MSECADSEIDIEAQPIVSQALVLRGGEKNEMNGLQSGTKDELSPSGQVPTINIVETDLEARATEVATPVLGGARNTLAPTHHKAHSDPSTRLNSPRDERVSVENSGQGPQQLRMIGDFDDSANALWTLYGKEAKSHDQARIQTLKDDMDGVLIFAGLFSATLTSFIINSIQNLQVSPAQQMVYYQQQNIAILVHISQQISSIAPQIVIPSTLPPPFPAFTPSPSDVRVNVFWFMALVFGLSAALLATLVQQWVRNYMHVFQRYTHPLKSARLRQYLYDGSEGWYMPVVAEAVPGLVHVSLFLFFVGLCDFVLIINTTVGISTVVPIAVSGFLYIFTMFAPVMHPQSPYQNSFSGLIWYLIQKIHGRKFKGRGSSGVLKHVSSNMAEGQMQLAMEETEERRGRDERAIRWLVNNLTEDAEMESFAMAIPGSFNTNWGVGLWKKVSGGGHANRNWNQPAAELHTSVDLSVPIPSLTPPSPRMNALHSLFGPIARLAAVRAVRDLPSDTNAFQTALDPPEAHPPLVLAFTNKESIVHELSNRVGHLFETCKNHGHFSSEESWRRRTRACVETAASLVFYANAELGWFGDIVKLLSDIGSIEKTRETLTSGSDQSFVIRWTCLSIVAIRRTLNDERLMMHATWAVMSLALFRTEDGTVDERALKNSQKIDENFGKAWKCLRELYVALLYRREASLTEEQVKEVLHNHESQISELERIGIDAERMQDIDKWITDFQHGVDRVTHTLPGQLPGVQFDAPHAEPVPLSQALVLFTASVKPQLILLRQRLQSLCLIGPKLRDIMEERNIEQYWETIESLKPLEKVPARPKLVGHLMERQLWRLQDLRHGSGLGFTIEIFFLALRQLLSTSSVKESYTAFYIGTFKAIVADWEKYKYSLGTQQVLLNLVCDIAAKDRGVFSNYSYPSYITDELLVLLRNMLEGEKGSHIDKAVRELRTARLWLFGERQKFLDRVLAVISQSRSRKPTLPLS